MLIDSNIIIYASQPNHDPLRRFIAEHHPAVSAISYVEVLGYHKLTDDARTLLEALFISTRLLPVSQSVLDIAVELRQQRRMSLGDALIAGTALANDLQLVTRNVEDFTWISDLTVINPFESSSN